MTEKERRERNKYWNKYWEEANEAIDAAEVLVEYCKTRDKNCKDCIFIRKEGCSLQPEGENPEDWELEDEDEDEFYD